MEKPINVYTAIEARKQLAEIINQVAYAGQASMITRSGKQMAVIISVETWEHYQQLVQSQQTVKETEPALTTIVDRKTDAE